MAVPFEHELWSAKEVAAYLKLSYDYVIKVLSKDPRFPSAIRLPTVDGGFTNPRWKAKKVVDWVESYEP
jgi:hypothetical protein